MATKIKNCPSNVANLNYDTACLQVINNLNYSVDLFTVSSECFQCDEAYWTTVLSNKNVSLVVPAVHSVQLSATRPNDDITLCEQTFSFSQHEVVKWDVQNCIFTQIQEGDDAFLPLYVLLACVVSLVALIGVGHLLYSNQWIKNLFNRDPIVIDMQNDLGNPNSSVDSLPLVQSELVPLRRLSSPRIMALDTFRGITIALMIFVNYGGGKYWFFEHSPWNGLTVADVVFPWFAWVMGVSLVLSYRSKLRSCVSYGAVVSVSLRRALVLITLGLTLNMYNHNDLASARFCGVLQRLGIAHLVVSTLEIAFMKKQPSFQYGRWLHVAELADSWRQWIVVGALTTVQVCVSLYRPVPGCPTGYLGPGGLANHSSYPNCTGGVARYIDSKMFGDNHLRSYNPAHRVYDTTVAFDPEGILGTLTTCLSVYLGVQAGYIILCYNTTLERSARWLFWALLTGVSAGFLCDWSPEGGLIPVNKQLWSLSYTLLTAATAFLFFTILFVIIDHCQWWSGHPFRHAGMNAIILYVGHKLTEKTFPWSWKPYNTTGHGEFLAMNVVGVLLWLLIARVLHRNEVFLTI